jgi:hypothetical protein
MPRIFDRLARTVEQYKDSNTHVRGLWNLMQHSRLFVFDKLSQDFLPKAYTVEEAEFANESFFLPFPLIAVEDAAGVVFVGDGTTKDRAHSRGAAHPRIVVDVIMRGTPDAAFREEGALPAWSDGINFHVSLGAVKNLHFAPGTGKKNYIEAAGWMVSLGLGNRVEVYEHSRLPQDTYMQAHKGFLENALVAMQEIVMFNNPNFFVVEEQCDKEVNRFRRHGAKIGRVARTLQRPTYSVLRPTLIRQRMKLPEPKLPSGVKVRPHERRAHLRRLCSDRYKNKKGQIVVVKACWVGPTEAVVGNRRYRVLTDLMPPKTEGLEVVE